MQGPATLVCGELWIILWNEGHMICLNMPPLAVINFVAIELPTPAAASMLIIR